MSFRNGRSADYMSSKTNRNDRYVQMSKQQQLIEEKKRQIQEKLDKQRRLQEAEDAVKKIETPSEPKKLVFSNDGSFLDQFKKISALKASQAAEERETEESDYSMQEKYCPDDYTDDRLKGTPGESDSKNPKELLQGGRPELNSQQLNLSQHQHQGPGSLLQAQAPGWYPPPPPPSMIPGMVPPPGLHPPGAPPMNMGLNMAIIPPPPIPPSFHPSQFAVGQSPLPIHSLCLPPPPPPNYNAQVPAENVQGNVQDEGCSPPREVKKEQDSKACYQEFDDDVNHEYERWPIEEDSQRWSNRRKSDQRYQKRQQDDYDYDYTPPEGRDRSYRNVKEIPALMSKEIILDSPHAKSWLNKNLGKKIPSGGNPNSFIKGENNWKKDDSPWKKEDVNWRKEDVNWKREDASWKKEDNWRREEMHWKKEDVDDEDSKSWLQKAQANAIINPPPPGTGPIIPPLIIEEDFIEVKKEIKKETESDQQASQRSERKRKSRWGEQKEQAPIPPVAIMQLPTNIPKISVPGMGGHMLSKVTRTDPGLLQYAMTAYGATNLTDEDWKKAEENYKVHLLYQDLMAKRAEIEKLKEAGKNKYEYDSDEEIDDKGTWEHKLREKEMVATHEWAESLTEMAKGKHHIGDFLPPDELKKFMAKYEAARGGAGEEPDLSDYKEYKLGEENKGFQMLQKLGWSEGQGLGSDGAGRLDPINKGKMSDSKEGLGLIRPDDIETDDDEYDAYRKRMMLAYRFRPNPLNNPRRPYY